MTRDDVLCEEPQEVEHCKHCGMVLSLRNCPRDEPICNTCEEPRQDGYLYLLAVGAEILWPGHDPFSLQQIAECRWLAVDAGGTVRAECWIDQVDGKPVYRPLSFATPQNPRPFKREPR